MSDEFPIDITISPKTAPGAEAVKRTLAEIEQRGRITSAKLAEVGRAIGAAGTGGSLDGLADQGDRIVDMFDGWKSGASGASGATSALSGVSQALGVNLTKLGIAGAAAFAAKKVIDYADAFTNLQNRLSTVTSSQAELTDVTERLFNVANETRSSFVATGEFYARLAASTGELGLSTSDLLDVTETLQKAFKVSGSSASESSAAMVQLAQGLASGTLRGDELNSVLEQAPILGHAIADSMGIAFGTLREVASQGGVTAKDVIAAVQSMQGEIDEKFAKTAPTFADLMTKLENQLVRFGGQIGPALAPIVDLLGSGIAIIGNSLAALGPAFAVVGDAVEGVVEVAKPLVSVLGEVLGLVGDIVKGTKENLETLGGAAKAVLSLSGSGNLDQLAKAARDEQALVESLAESISTKLVTGLKALQQTSERTVQSLNLVNTAIAIGTVNAMIDAAKAFADADKAINPVNAATREYAELTQQLTLLVNEQVIAEEEAVEILHQKAVALSDLKDPVGARIGQIKEETANLLELSKAGKLEAEFLKEKQRLLETGIPLTQADEVALAKAVRAHYEAEKAVNKHTAALEKHHVEMSGGVALIEKQIRLMDPYREFNETLGATVSNPDMEAFAVEAALVAKETENLADEYERASKSFEENPWIVATEGLRNINLELSAVSAGLGVATGLMDRFVDGSIRSFADLGNAIADFVTQAIADLTKLFLQQQLYSLLGAAGVLPTAPVPGALPNFGLGGSAPGLTPITGSTGGSWMVGGDGGVDTTPVYMRLTRGERVTVQTPAQQRGGDPDRGGDGGRGRGGNVVVQVVDDPERHYATFNSGEYDRAVARTMRRRPSLVRAGR